jgi:hypothetical protein
MHKYSQDSMELYGLSGVSRQAILQVTLNKRDLADLPNADIVPKSTCYIGIQSSEIQPFAECPGPST